MKTLEKGEKLLIGFNERGNLEISEVKGREKK
ncbi:hypothetical protein MTLP_10830 [Candidatus Methanoliparum sp. LAM-1]|nr:hypothetical protein MTLP_10830 [Candidatus Methanoliparum sp. LAM-1]